MTKSEAKQLVLRTIRELETARGDLPNRTLDAHELTALIDDQYALYQYLKDDDEQEGQ